jgi:hypothetical protein
MLLLTMLISLVMKDGGIQDIELSDDKKISSNLDFHGKVLELVLM